MKSLTAVRPVALLPLCMLLLSSCWMHKHTAKTQKRTETMYHSLKDALPTGEVTLLQDSIRVIFPKNVMFDFNMAVVKPDMNPAFEQFAGVLKQYRKARIFVIGRTDSVGGDRTNNQQLSERRADSARNMLLYYGVKERRMEHWGVGAKDPIATNGTEEGRARNRCVEFIVLTNK